ncbi:hypothetical protein MICAK_2770012 [Microcystis aeruginosa PCC 9701]|uniref:Uncharacterized protein n=1 Tax=Microcystis aeruginosa PCC 9701 TaxID=721123 RepID=I4IRE4_MICAE|nr:hypothetical protein MICAK_2770012 [Microcystis aeruginosa PCC 9701]
MYMVRSPKSSAGAVGATLGNAPYGDGDRTLLWIDAVNDPIAGGKDGLEIRPACSHLHRACPTLGTVLPTLVIIPQQFAIRLDCVDDPTSSGKDRLEVRPACSYLLRAGKASSTSLIIGVSIPEQFAIRLDCVDDPITGGKDRLEALPACSYLLRTLYPLNPVRPPSMSIPQ